MSDENAQLLDGKVIFILKLSWACDKRVHLSLRASRTAPTDCGLSIQIDHIVLIMIPDSSPRCENLGAFMSMVPR